jgi:hypothetical protein
MPPKQVRRQREENTNNQEEFSGLPVATLARLAAPKTITIDNILLEIPATQLSQQATSNMITAKMLFQPAASFGISDEDLKPSKTQDSSKKSGEKSSKKKKGEESDNEEEEQEDPLGAILGAASRNIQQQKSAIGTRSQQPNYLPRRIITSINDITNVKPIGTKSSARGGELIKLSVSVTVDTIVVLSDGFCSAMICRSATGKHAKDDDAAAEELAGQLLLQQVSSQPTLKLSFVLSNHFLPGAVTKKKNDNDEDDDSSSDFFTINAVPLDANNPVFSKSAPGKHLGGKKVLVSIENNGTSWRAHLGITPPAGTISNKSQQGGHWETHMPWSRGEKREQWNFRAPPPSQRSNENRIVIKFVKDEVKS